MMTQRTRKDFIHIDDLSLLPQTRDFFETHSSRAIPLFLTLVAASLGLFLAWACFARMDDVVKAPAVIRPAQTVSALKCLASGEVVAKQYVQNQKVLQGELLLSLDDSSEKTELENVIKQLAKTAGELEDTGILLASISSGRNEAKKESHGFAKTASYLDEYRRQLNEIDRLRRELADEQDMPPALRVPKKIEECRSKLEQAQLSCATWKNNRIVEARNAENTLKEQQHNLETRKATLERTIKDSSLYAPIDGIIEECTPLNKGDYVLSGSEIVKIIPVTGDFLKAQITLDAAHIARVKIGQEAKLRFPGLPPATFGQISARVSLIPADMTVTSSVPVFEVQADIRDPFLVSAAGEKIFLRPGVSAEARVIIARATVLRMILRRLDFLH